MITNEAEIRIALQAVLVSVLALYGFWGCALVVVFILLPWKPILAVGAYLVQPLVDWRIQKARIRHEKGIAQIEQELDALLRAPKTAPRTAAPAAAVKPAAPAKPSPCPLPRPLESFKPRLAARPFLPEYARNRPGPFRHPGDSTRHQRPRAQPAARGFPQYGSGS